ncbi:MAG: type I-E CRISPR-associated protein Cse2/CasB [Pseudomonadota bacterium]|nr:type I-E CRISPR-associated protein Cse2/CasB [Pseudomonadota bacterium]
MQEELKPVPTLSKSNDELFVDLVIERCQKDKGMAARLRRADNPSMEYQSWEFLGALEYLGVDLEYENKRLPFVTLAAAIAKSKSEFNGKLTLGQAIAGCYKEGREDSQAKTRLRRLLACTELAEVCRILRPILTLIESRVTQPLDYVRLLRQLRFFSFESGYRVKTQWAKEFYSQTVLTEEGAS